MSDIATAPVEIDWDIVPGEDESTLTDDMADLAKLNGGLPTWVIIRALKNIEARTHGNGLILDLVQEEITRVARELVERGTSGA